jgi:DNA-binding NarL/FixJ family response regulator
VDRDRPAPGDTARMSIRVLIADDQAVSRQGLRMILGSQPDIEVVGEAIDGLDALGQAERKRPDVVLMDIRMPRMDGLEATRRLRDDPDVQVVVITTFDLDEYVLEALRAGAVGFLVKDSTAERIIDAVRVVHRGGCSRSSRPPRRPARGTRRSTS